MSEAHYDVRLNRITLHIPSAVDRVDVIRFILGARDTMISATSDKDFEDTFYKIKRFLDDLSNAVEIERRAWFTENIHPKLTACVATTDKKCPWAKVCAVGECRGVV